MDFGFSTNSQAQPVEQPQSKMPNNTILSTYREQIRMAMMNYAKACSLLNTNNSVVGIVNGCLADFEKKIKDKVDGGSSSSSGLGFLGMGGMRKRRRSTSSKKKTSTKKTSTKKKSSSKKNKKFLGIRLKNIGLSGGAKSKRKSSTKKRTSRKKKSVKKNAEFLGIKLKNIGLSGGKSKRRRTSKKTNIKKRSVKKLNKNLTKRTTKKRRSSKKSKKSNFFGLNLKSIGL